MEKEEIFSLFLDIGGVLLTNGWDRTLRQRAAREFDLDEEEMNERHHLTFDTYEEGKLSLDQYLSRVVFHRRRSFSRDDFRNFMMAQYHRGIQLARSTCFAWGGLRQIRISRKKRKRSGALFPNLSINRPQLIPS